MQSTPRNDRPYVIAGVAALVIITATFVVASYTTSDHMDRSAAGAGSSTSSQAPNTRQDQSVAKPPVAATTGSDSNVPPANRTERDRAGRQ